MSGFTSTTLLSLVVAAIRKIDPVLAGGHLQPDPMHAGVSPDADKTSLLAAFAARHGHAALLQIGQHLDLAEESPVLAVLTKSPDPAVLAAKWMRLERYFHSSHRTRIDTAWHNRWTCRRTSLRAPADAAENILIAGVQFGLLERIGVRDCRLVIDQAVVARRDFDTFKLQSNAAEYALFWSADQACHPPARSQTSTVNDQLAGLLSGDIGRSWKLKDAARALAFSDRSLQRKLGASGRSFSSVLRRARMREATYLLTETQTPLAEIGYCCGYADQAHFHRDFRRVTNMTPRAFRDVSGPSGLDLHASHLTFRRNEAES